MRDPARIDAILRALRAAWEAQPDLRLGQLVSNAAHVGGWRDPDVFHAEDDVLARGLLALADLAK